MTPTEARAVRSMALRLQNCATDEQARLVFTDSLEAGAPFDSVIDAMREWCETHAADVQTIVRTS
jgi:hypothetical protein